MVVQLTHAQTVSDEIKHHKQFYILPSATLEVSNKYGNIHFSTWDKDSVSIDIHFFIAEKNETKFMKIKDNVNFKTTGNSSYLIAETVFGSKYSSFFKNIKEATNLQTPESSSSRIDYFISVPSHINLKVNNRYGNVFIPDISGNINVDLSNGDFQAKKLSGINTLKLAFGDVLIDELKQSTLDLNFCSVNINEATQLDIQSKSSEVKIKTCQLVKLQSKRDEYDIDELDNLFGETYFSKLSILKLNREFNMVMQYGTLKNVGLTESYELFKVNANYANCNIELINPSNYKCLITAPKATINIPSELKAAEGWRSKIETEPVVFNYQGSSGKEKIQISISDASLNINHK